MGCYRIAGDVCYRGIVGDRGGTQPSLRGAQAAKEADKAKDKQSGADTPSAVAPTLDTKKQPREYEPDCSKHENADLCAQRRMAEAAEAQTRLNEIGLWLLGFTLLATGIAAFYARRAALAARQTVVTMENTAERQLRAYVFGRPNNIEFDCNIPRRLHFAMRNFGQTPAYAVTLDVRVTLCPHPLPAGFVVGGPTAPRATCALGPGAEVRASRSLGRPLSDEIMRQMQADSHRFYAFGFIRYRDAFQKERTTRFCASLRWPGIAAFGQQGAHDIEWETTEGHNEAD